MSTQFTEGYRFPIDLGLKGFMIDYLATLISLNVVGLPLHIKAVPSDSTGTLQTTDVNDGRT